MVKHLVFAAFFWWQGWTEKTAEDLVRKLRTADLVGLDVEFTGNEILRRNLHLSAVREVLQHGGWEGSQWLSQSLVRRGTDDGTRLSLLAWLRDQAKEEAPAEIGSMRRLADRDDEEQAARRVSGLPEHYRQSALLAYLDQKQAGQFGTNSHRVPPEDVQVGVYFNFLKVTDLDLKKALLVLPVWMRLTWTDPRLRFNASLWGLNRTHIQLAQNDLEQSLAWSPDIELYNSETSFVLHEFHQKEGAVYADGSVVWSRNGNLRVLCKFAGLSKFPFDTLRCNVKFGAWMLDGSAQNLVFSPEFGSHDFADKSDSAFQNYLIMDVTAKRQLESFSCCPNPFPVVEYTLHTKRATRFYILRLVIPQICLSLLSLITFYISPTHTDRLGYGVTLLVFAAAIEFVADEYMPVCREFVLMDTINLTAWIMCLLALFESGLVLALLNLTALHLEESILPQFLLQWLNLSSSDENLMNDLVDANPEVSKSIFRLGKRKGLRKKNFTTAPVGPASHPPAMETDGLDQVVPIDAHGENADSSEDEPKIDGADARKKGSGASAASDDGGQDGALWYLPSLATQPGQSQKKEKVITRKVERQIRLQMYREVFFLLDGNFSGKLEKEEVSAFGHFMLGDDWNKSTLETFMKIADVDGDAGLNYKEFSDFCEQYLLTEETISAGHKHTSQMVKSFVSLTRTKAELVKLKWQNVARSVDRFFRCFTPAFFLLMMSLVFSVDFDDEDL
mmetsp:Transcript_96191/g.170776  ORF Transcript_96191/g.170776 Transcript_96191/m.170776 type:complete len:732 (-) Transcript_96191:90-2285(-)